MSATTAAPVDYMSPLPSATTTGTLSSSYHLQYEKKQKNVSRLYATFIAPITTTSTTTERIIISAPPANTIHSSTSSPSSLSLLLPAAQTAFSSALSSSLQPSPLPSPSPPLTTTRASLPPSALPSATKGPTIIYPTVAPESVVIPIVSSIIGFPILALLVICCLRKRAKMARERDRRRNYDTQDNSANLVRFGHRLNGRNSRTLSVCSERSISWAYPSMDLDTVYEERSDPEPYRDKY